MTRRKGLRSDETAYLFRELSENESVCGELSLSDLDSEKDIQLNEKVRSHPVQKDVKRGKVPELWYPHHLTEFQNEEDCQQ
ncbi:hypothetical protein TNCV_3749591 [Trichonephila clavipes]|nr:hypothetical protein TNCV_3749591 [Trichonephila clavipes]